ncbi:MAG: ABC transporter permease [Spirochaetae bacterium HGW-Spirochaetae-3]|jgi:simple sugar transport system permease protein|nr:MAG: ABC transporter permease [Spirochaetae bacterium HGW-Spirochaetae-3]
MNKSGKLAYNAAIVIAAAAAAMGIGAIVLAAVGADIGKAYAVILTEPLKDMIGITEIVVRAVPLSLIALGIAIAFRSGILNIGAEGQMLMGILACSATAIAGAALPKPILVPLAILAGAAGGAVWGGIAGVLRAKLGVNEILSTVMLNYIAAQFYTFLLRGPMMDPEELVTGSGTPQTVRMPRSAWLDRLIPGTRLHTGVFIAIGLAIVVFFLLWRTTAGFRMRAAGAEAKAARYAGVKVERYLVIAMLLSGAFAGMAGAVEILGVHRRAIEGISGGYGFTGIVVALFGGLHPAGIIPASLFFGLLLLGADMTQRLADVPANMVLVLQGAIILAIVSARQFINNPYVQDKLSRALAKLFGRAAPPAPPGSIEACPDPSDSPDPCLAGEPGVSEEETR